MKKILLTCLAAITFSACGGDTTTSDTSNAKKELAKVSENTVAKMTKNKPNAITSQATDAWFIHRISSVFEKVKPGRTDCYLKGEFENKGDVALYTAQVKYQAVFIENASTGAITNQQVGVEVAPEYGKPNLNPLLPGEIRPVDLGLLYLPCERFKEIKLVAFVAKGINSDGTVKHRAVKDGAPALIIDNKTDFKVTREIN